MHEHENILDGYFTDAELARQLGVKPRTTKSWRNQRKGPPPTYLSGKPLYRKAAVMQWLRAREIDLSKRTRRELHAK